MELDIAGQAIIKSINMRAEHEGEDRELGVDIKLELKTDLEALANFGPALKSLLYSEADDPDKRKLRMPLLKPLGINDEAEHHTLHIADQSYDDVTLSKFDIAAEDDGRVTVTMTASLSAVDADLLPMLARLYLERTVNVDIEPQQGDLFSEAA